MRDYTQLSNFQRLIPQGGLRVYPYVKYVDVNDIPEEKRQRSRTFIRNSPVYSTLLKRSMAIRKGLTNGRQYCAYVFKRGEHLGFVSLKEKLNNPHGYGKDDFMITKFVLPKFQHTKYSRYLGGDMIHFSFYSGLARNLYSYMPANREKKDYYWDKVLQDLPCLGKRYDTDTIEVQKYISIKREFETKYGPYILVEFSGDVYNNMDLIQYFMTSPGRNIDIVMRWLKEMNEASAKIKETLSGSSSH